MGGQGCRASSEGQIPVPWFGSGGAGGKREVAWEAKFSSGPQRCPTQCPEPDRLGVIEWNHMSSEKWKAFSGWCPADVRDGKQE